MIAIDFQNVFVYHNDADNFTAQVFRLIAKADKTNREKLRRAFPLEVDLYEHWMNQQIEHPPLDMIESWVAQIIAFRPFVP